MRTINLGGHSGCKILLCEEDNNNVFVRKISRDYNYNKRLEIQADKQARYKSALVKAPKVLEIGYTKDRLFYFDMEYVQGITLAEYIKTIEIGKVRGLCENIVKNVVNINPTNNKSDEKIFKSKIKELEQELQGKNNPVLDEAFKMLESHCWKRFVKSFCHGDLTLENIIVKDNQLYIIDFLDSFYDSWIMDISTIMQDVQTMWSYRLQKEISINTSLRLMVFRDILVDTVKQYAADVYIEVYYALLLKLIRIYPYTKDKETFDFLDMKIDSVINIIRKEQSICVH